MVSDAELVGRLREFLRTSDLTTMTMGTNHLKTFEVDDDEGEGSEEEAAAGVKSGEEEEEEKEEEGEEEDVETSNGKGVVERGALKAHDLSGTLPPELTRLTYLQDIDLSRNYLKGIIPPEWGSMVKLVNISLLGNRLTGPIPKEFGNINTLGTLRLEFNQLSGPIPPELGSLPLLEKLHLTSNNFSGELPETLAKLTTLTDFRIGDNHFTGNVPDFIKNWVNLNKLVIQGSGLDGPIPLGIGLLTNLSDLRISDLNGSQASFPPLKNLTSLKTLILRSCNIIGPLPEYLGEMTNFMLLDLSFNNLSGDIPSTFTSQSSADNIVVVDRSPSLSINEEEDQNGADRRSHCRWRLDWSSIYINCGGKEVSLGGNMTYEDDEDPAGPSKFYQSRTNWAFSSTGNFLDDDRHQDSFIWTSLPNRLSVKNLELYTDARISPISLTYYGFCLLLPLCKVKTSYMISFVFLFSLLHAVINEPVNEPPYGISATAFVIILFLGILWLRVFLTRKDTMDQDLKGLDLQTGSFTLAQIKAATNNFDEANKI
ncbi:hypothetical protein RHGRI_009815 [Rhododendron griersonianum]|uniref:Uncharacterized protein n=1 Tax=Rhododendron griersonianum TaxID=479676 RepID=A0AAV6KGT8_9ERIC|nr:hypothetical protein RHGRI_009815 [Rhododendron griersonianum]